MGADRKTRRRKVVVRCGARACGARLLVVDEVYIDDRHGDWLGGGVYLVGDDRPLSWRIGGTYYGRWADDGRIVDERHPVRTVALDDGTVACAGGVDEVGDRWAVVCSCGATHSGTTRPLVDAITRLITCGGDVFLPLDGASRQ